MLRRLQAKKTAKRMRIAFFACFLRRLPLRNVFIGLIVIILGSEWALI